MTFKKLDENVSNLAKMVAGKIKAISVSMGDLSSLSTEQKNSLVGALNELKSKIDEQAKNASGIDDNESSSVKVWSSEKVSSEIQKAISALVNGADSAYDTLKEVAEYINQDKSTGTALATAVGNRVRYDEAQVLTEEQKKRVCENIGIGDPNTDFVAIFNQALGE